MSDELLRAKPEKYQVNRGIGKPVEFKGAPVEVFW